MRQKNYQIIQNQEKEKAILVGLVLPGMSFTQEEDSLDELAVVVALVWPPPASQSQKTRFPIPPGR